MITNIAYLLRVGGLRNTHATSEPRARRPFTRALFVYWLDGGGGDLHEGWQPEQSHVVLNENRRVTLQTEVSGGEQ